MSSQEPQVSAKTFPQTASCSWLFRGSGRRYAYLRASFPASRSGSRCLKNHLLLPDGGRGPRIPRYADHRAPGQTAGTPDACALGSHLLTSSPVSRVSNRVGTICPRLLCAFCGPRAGQPRSPASAQAAVLLQTGRLSAPRQALGPSPWRVVLPVVSAPSRPSWPPREEPRGRLPVSVSALCAGWA